MNSRAIETTKFGGAPAAETTSLTGCGSLAGMNAKPDRIGKYRVVRQAGRGGFGRVYEAIDPALNRVVAIKVLNADGGDLLERFEYEARVTGNLHHQNIVTAHDYGEHEGSPYLVMEYLEGETLDRIIGSHKPLTLLETCNIMTQVAEGLCYAHGKSVVHRDVKPANIMVLSDGTIKIMDFGIAKLAGEYRLTPRTQAGCLVGTLLYMAPEQLEEAEVDSSCDIFAFGVIFYQMLTGTHPFEASSPATVMNNIRLREPHAVRSLNPECPPALEQIVAGALRKDREARYQSFSALRIDLEQVRTALQCECAATLLVQRKHAAPPAGAAGARVAVSSCGPVGTGAAPLTRRYAIMALLAGIVLVSGLSAAVLRFLHSTRSGVLAPRASNVRTTASSAHSGAEPGALNRQAAESPKGDAADAELARTGGTAGLPLTQAAGRRAARPFRLPHEGDSKQRPLDEPPAVSDWRASLKAPMLDIPGEDQIAAGVPRLTIQARHVHRLGHGNGLLTLDGREHYRFEEASARHRMEGAFTEIRLLCGTGRLWCSIRLEIEGHKQTLEIMRSDASVFQKP